MNNSTTILRQFSCYYRLEVTWKNVHTFQVNYVRGFLIFLKIDKTYTQNNAPPTTLIFFDCKKCFRLPIVRLQSQWNLIYCFYIYLKMYVYYCLYLSRVMRQQTFCICENKDADQLRGNREADQRLCFRYLDSTIPLFLNPKFQASSHLQ